MKLYDSYTNTIREAIQKNKSTRNFSESQSNFNGLSKSLEFKSLNSEVLDNNLIPASSLKPLGDLMLAKPSTTSKLGEHPDFVNLKGTNKTEMHYITSVFIDIKGSTHLHKEYDLETIHIITNTIQKAAIHTCILFGGHIQRLQGDGVFIYFGGKNIDKKTAAQMALSAASFFTYFVKNDLKNIFEGEGIEDINTRIGIDFGDDDKVMWANYGLGTCSELTTNSLHTSLASKMQSHATSNGIVIGENVSAIAGLSEDLYDYVKDSYGAITKRYIYEDRKKNFYYTQYRFDWYKYLKSLSYIKSDENGGLYIYTPAQQEKDRVAQLRKTALTINSGNAYTDARGNITSNSLMGIKNQDHRFHYED